MQPTFIQQDPSYDRRRRLAQALIQKGSSTAPIEHPLQGIAQLAQALSGRSQLEAIDKEAADRAEAYSKTISDAMGAYKEGIPATTAPFVPDRFEESDVLPQGLRTEVPAQPGGIDAMAAVLAGSPDTASLGLDLQLKNMQAKRAAELAEQKYRRGRDDKRSDIEFASELAGKRDIAKIRAKTETPGADIVQSSEILPDGTVQQVFKSGKVVIVTPEQHNVDKIKEARRYGAEVQGLRSGERAAASEGQKQSVKAFTGLVKARSNISSIDQAIKAIDKGANTGVVVSMLPSVTAASIELDNLQNQLGLDVIGNVTFGALSKGELDLALSTALPTSMQPADLRQWLEAKRVAQTKLADYLQEAAVYLGEPGNTVASFLQERQDLFQPVGDAAQPGAAIPNVGDDLTPEERVELEELRRLKAQQR